NNTLGVSGPDQHAARPGDESVHVPLIADEVVGTAARVGTDLDGPTPVVCRDPGGHPQPSVEIAGERGGAGVELDSWEKFEAKLVRDHFSHRDAQSAAGVAHHEIY